MKRLYIAAAMAVTITLSACNSADEETKKNTEETILTDSVRKSSEITKNSSPEPEITRMTREQAADLCRKDGIGDLRPEEMIRASLIVDTAEETESGWNIDGEFSISNSGETIPMSCTAFNGINGNLPHAIAMVFDFRGLDPENFNP